MVLHRHDLRAGFLEEPRRDAADIAETLYRNARAFDRKTDAPRRFATDHEHAAAGRLAAAERAAERNRLAGHDAGRRLALVHRVRVHHPRHDLLVRVDVRRGNIGVRPDDDADFTRVTARHAL